MAFSQETINFLVENKLNDSRDWFHEHKEQYQEFVIRPMAELAQALTPCMKKIDPEFVTEPRVDKTISRIWRDTRYSHDPSLYRDNMWLIFKRKRMHTTEYPGMYFDFSPEGFSYGGGFYSASPAYMEAMRRKILMRNRNFESAEKAYRAQNVFVMEGEKYKKAHFPDQPENLREWLERRNLCFTAENEDMDLLFSGGLAQKLAEDFEKMAPMYQFLMSVALEDSAEW